MFWIRQWAEAGGDNRIYAACMDPMNRARLQFYKRVALHCFVPYARRDSIVYTNTKLEQME